jgi:2-C-methyl-D-erythritol 4-phosphate cytidylyltransferase
MMGGKHFTKPVRRVDGGDERHRSVAMGLAAIDPAAEFVAVHDGARPLVSPADIDACVAAASDFRAASLARRATETMKRADENGFCIESVCRENLWCMETPQVFETALLREAYRLLEDRGLAVTDEVSAVQELGIKVKFIESRHPNLKITTPADLALAEALMK